MREATIGAPDALYLAALKDEDINVVISDHREHRIEAAGWAGLPGARDRTGELAADGRVRVSGSAGGHRNRQTLDALRTKYPNLAEVPGIYLLPFLKLLGHTAGPESIEEICRTIEEKGAFVHEAAIDALTNIALRHSVSQLNSFCEAGSAAFSSRSWMRACAFIFSVCWGTLLARAAWRW
jgi:hypothetical protein